MVGDKISELFDNKVNFTAYEGFATQFLKECKKQEIKLLNVKTDGNTVYASVYGKDFEKIDSAARRSGMIVEITGEKGISHIFSIIKNRFYVPLGVFAALIVFGFFSSLIWSINISGCEKVSSDSVNVILKNYGVKKGCFACNVDCNALEKAITSSDKLIYSTTVTTEGTQLFVHITENTEPEKISTDTTYSNIVAGKTGKIKKIDVIAGVSDIKSGDTVEKGELIVSGIYETENGLPIFTDSECIIKAETEYFIKSSAASVPDVCIPVKRRNFFSLYIFGLKLLPSAQTLKGEVFTIGYFASNGSVVLPLGIIRLRETEFEQTAIELDDNKSFLVAFNDFAINTEEKLGEKKTVSRNICVCKGNQTTVEGNFVCEEDIGQKIYFEADLQYLR